MLWRTNFEKVNLCKELDETQQIDSGRDSHKVTVALPPDETDDDFQVEERYTPRSNPLNTNNSSVSLHF